MGARFIHSVRVAIRDRRCRRQTDGRLFRIFKRPFYGQSYIAGPRETSISFLLDEKSTLVGSGRERQTRVSDSIMTHSPATARGLFKCLTALPVGRFYRFEHIVPYSSGKVVAKWISFTATIVLLDDMPLFPKKCDGHLMFRGRRPHQDSPTRLACQWPKLLS
jgi:hypothetical protein